MRLSLRLKLIGAFLPVVLITGIIASAVGLHLISMNVVREVQEKVRTDLNTAREIYLHELSDIQMTLALTSARACAVRDALSNNDRTTLLSALQSARTQAGLDLLTITDKDGIVVLRARNPDVYGDNQAEDILVRRVLRDHEAVFSTEIVPREELVREGDELVAQACVQLVPTPRAKQRADHEVTSCMMLRAAVPVFDQQRNLIGVLHGGRFINKSFGTVDRVKETVYQGITYKGRDAGTATIFQNDLRVSTNVLNADGSRAVGTRVSEEVNDAVLGEGTTWVERAFVVNSWYISAYEPIRNINGTIIGMLSVGVMEQKYTDLRNATIGRFCVITLAGMLLAVLVSSALAGRIVRPVRSLVAAAKDLARGDFSPRVPTGSRDEIGELGGIFNFMASSLEQRDEELRECAQRQIMKSEKLATIGQLAAGVAHEINNPLGGILVLSHLLLEDIDEHDPKRGSLERIEREAMRCKTIIRGLLDFARQTEPSEEPVDIHQILQGTLAFLENHPLFQNISIKTQLSSDSVEVMADRGQMQQVFVNIMMNAAEAMEAKGVLTISTAVAEEGGQVEIEFADTGCGIREEDVERLFEPFFTTKEVGQGTGLGLSISYGIIDRHEGTIEVKSEVGVGTRFVIRLPRIRPHAE